MYNWTRSSLDSGGESDNSPESRKKCWINSTADAECRMYTRMADRSDDDSDYGDDVGAAEDLNSVREKIHKLEKEKAKLEKQNAERHMLEQKRKELSKSVSVLKSANSGYGSSSKGSQSSVDKNNRIRASGSEIPSSSGSGIADMLNEQRVKLNRLAQNRGDSGSTPHEIKENETESDEEEESRNLDQVMSKGHKQKLQDHRDTLVESLIPDDILNDLIANKVLMIGDVSRIKEKNTQEAMNEELLNNLGRRSDRAFYVFVKSLRKTLQGYLADLIDEPQPKPPPKKMKRKRQKAEMNVSVDCESVLPLPKRKPTCSCQEVEEQILIMARTAYNTIRRRDHTPASFEQFKKELSQTNDIIKDTMEIMHTLKILCNHGNELSDISYGSVKFTIRCGSLGSADELWDMYTSGALLDVLQRGLITKSLLRRCHARAVELRVRIPEEEYLQCVKDLEGDHQLSENFRSSEKSFKLCSGHTRVLRSKCRSRTEEMCKSSCPSWQKDRTRHAFREIQKNLATVGDASHTKAMITECEKVSCLTPRKRLLFHPRLRSSVS